jgi:hypothetical protein
MVTGSSNFSKSLPTCREEPCKQSSQRVLGKVSSPALLSRASASWLPYHHSTALPCSATGAGAPGPLEPHELGVCRSF